MNSHLKLILAVVGIQSFLLATVSTKSIPGIEQVPTQLVNGSSPAENLRLVGRLEGKSYYIANAVARTWSQADVFCRQAGLEGLATIDNTREWDFLQSFGEIRTSALWTGGREYLTMMGWGNQVPVNPSLIKIFTGGVEQGGRCLALLTLLGMGIYPCDTGIGTLCQSRA